MPADLEALASNPDWIDVTDTYRPYINGSKAPNFLTSGAGMKNLFEAQGQVNILMRHPLAQAGGISRKLGELTATMNEHIAELRTMTEQLMARKMRKDLRKTLRSKSTCPARVGSPSIRRTSG